VCEELRERYDAFKRRDLYEVRLAALFLDATYISVRPSGPKEGVLVAWGFTEDGERILLSVTLGMRESHEDWQELGRDLIARGLGAPPRPQPLREAARARARTRQAGLLAGARRRDQRGTRQAATRSPGRPAR
jgi:Transposase, Mutator family